MRNDRRVWFPAWPPGRADWLLAVIVLILCFFVFYHGDIRATGLSSLNYLFGSPLEFYDNCKIFVGKGESILGTCYLPPTYLVFACALYLLKLLGLITDPTNIPPVGVYVCKGLVTAIYVLSGWVFYRITAFYSEDPGWRKFATAVYLTSPLLIFTQFVFSQCDIFYIVLTLIGYGLILRRRVFAASVVFGLAITFKAFPAFVYLPLLLLIEKRFWQLAASGLLFILPTALLHVLYSGSPAFVEGVINHPAHGRVFAAGIDLEGWKIIFLFSGFAILCGWSYLASPGPERLVSDATFTFLAGSILPFLFVNWHPQWLASVMPAIVLTSMTDKRWDRFLALDLAGMAFLLATTVTFFPHIEEKMVRLQLLRAPEQNGWSMGMLVNIFGSHSASVYASLFFGYLLLQLVAKAKPVPLASCNRGANGMTMGYLRLRLYGGLAIFIAPLLATVLLSVAWPLKGHVSSMNDVVPGELFGPRVFEQTITGRGGKLRAASLFLGTYRRVNSGTLKLEILNADGTHLLAASQLAAGEVHDNAWCNFPFEGILLAEGHPYRLRLTSADSQEGNAVTWYASDIDKYPGGQAFVGGQPWKGDFAVRLDIGD